jgi:8-amino-7-oxononanoate synthase
MLEHPRSAVMLPAAMDRMEQELEAIRQAGLWRKLTPYAVLGAQPQGEMRSFASNDYLGLAHHPAITQAFHEGLQRFGHGAASSRLVCGTSTVHAELEADLAALKSCEQCLTFTSGYAAAMGTIPALLGPGDFVIVDKLSHACLIDAAKLSGATLRVFPHNHREKLEALLRSIRDKHGSQPRVLIITESVFSMDGDTAPLRELVDLKQKYGAWLLVDEAHGFGVFGTNGAGMAEACGVQAHIDIQMGTLSKAAGLSGGFIAGSSSLIALLINRARSFIYSTAPPPALAHAARQAVALIRSDEGRALRQRLQENIRLFTANTTLPRHHTPIIPVILGENETTLAAAQMLLDAGFIVPAIRYPTVPRNTARLRISLSAAHEKASLLRLKELCRKIAPHVMHDEI